MPIRSAPLRRLGPPLRRRAGRYRLASLSLLTALSLLPAAGAAASPTGERTVTPPRSMWVWSVPSATKLVSWASRHQVGELYVHVKVDSFTGAELVRLKDLKRRAGAAGIRLSALGGDPGWVFDPASAVRWRRAVLDSGLFSGSHLDVEPHLLTEWTSDPAGAVVAYLRMLDAVRAAEARASRAVTKATDARPLEVDVAFWYGMVPGPAGGTFADEILRRVDGVAVMSYRDRGTGDRSIMEVGTDLLERATTLGKRARLGAETNRDVECPSCTFFEEGQGRLTGALAEVDIAAGRYPAYQGMAIHDDKGWSGLRR